MLCVLIRMGTIPGCVTAPVSFASLPDGQKAKVKVSHSLIAAGAVGVGIPLFLAYSK